MRKTLTLAVLCAAFGFALGRSSATRAKPDSAPEPELVAGAEIVVAYPVAAVAHAVEANPRPAVARQRLRVFRHDTPGADAWKETAWVVRVAGREYAAAPAE